MFGQRTQQLQQQLDSFSALPRGWVLAIAATLIAGGVYFVSTTTGSPSDEPLFGGGPLREFDLDQVEMAFGAAGLQGWRREEQQIYVPRESRHKYLAALQTSSALPYTLHSAVEEALETGGYFESDSVRRMRTQYAKARDLGNKLTAFADVDWASVDYDEQEAGGFGQQIIRSASVVVVPADGKPLPTARILMIQEMVAGAYAGMSNDDVVVTDTLARESTAGVDGESLHRFHIERELEERITKLLAAYGQTHVAVKLGNDQLTRVSIGVCEQHFRNLWGTRHQSSESAVPELSQNDLQALVEETSANLRVALTPLLGEEEANEFTIRVWAFPNTELQAGDVHFASTSSETLNWLEELRQNPVATVGIGAVLFAAIILALMSLRLQRHRRVMESTTSMAEQTLPIHQQEDSSLKEDLAELVEANPELAAQIVHGWMDAA
ncbi:MAG: hypothetical protein AAFX06_09415 [Planctomycetota bacterium]